MIKWSIRFIFMSLISGAWGTSWYSQCSVQSTCLVQRKERGKYYCQSGREVYIILYIAMDDGVLRSYILEFLWLVNCFLMREKTQSFIQQLNVSIDWLVFFILGNSLLGASSYWIIETRKLTDSSKVLIYRKFLLGASYNAPLMSIHWKGWEFTMTMNFDLIVRDWGLRGNSQDIQTQDRN